MVRARGGEHVLDSSAPDFAARLAGLVRELNATLFLDAIGGDMTRQLMDAAPYGSTLLLYSKMSEQDATIDPFTALVKDLRLHGWFLPNWLKTKGLWQSIALFNRAQKLLATDLAPHVGARVPMASAQAALETYMQSMTNHKVLIQMEEA